MSLAVMSTLSGAAQQPAQPTANATPHHQPHLEPKLPTAEDGNLRPGEGRLQDDTAGEDYHKFLLEAQRQHGVGSASEHHTAAEIEPQPRDSGFNTMDDSSPIAASAIRHGDQAYEYEPPTGGYAHDATASGQATPSRHGTLKKRPSQSLSRRNSVLKRSDSKRSLGGRSLSAGSHRSGKQGIAGNIDYNSFFNTPIPTNSNPTDVLAKRFESWRKVIKDFIVYFTDVKKSYEERSRSSNKVYQSLNSTVAPPRDVFSRTGGILDTNIILKDFHKQGYAAAEQAAQAIQAEIISHLNALRGDLGLKIKEIKGLSGDFKNTVEKEKEATRGRVNQLQDALSQSDGGSASGKTDPYIVKLTVDKQLRRQLHEENYLHRAFLNLEGSGRELESVIVDQIQKCFETYVNIIRREGDDLLEFSSGLEAGPLSVERDAEWTSFVRRDRNFINPDLKIRNFGTVTYPGCDHPSTAEIRSGLLERKSKYLKSYTPGWYVLSPSHIHEFKTADRNSDMVPVMSLYLPDSSLGQHSSPTSSSHKFILKAKQTGSLHRSSGHSWTFRAESHETMLAWYEDIKSLVQLSGPGVSKDEKAAFVTRHRRATSNASAKSNGHSSVSSGGDDRVDEMDEADQVAFASGAAAAGIGAGAAAIAADRREAEEGYVHQPRTPEPVRPEPGGRFPSDIQLDRGLQAHHRTRSTTSGESDRSLNAAAGVLPSSQQERYQQHQANRTPSPYAPQPVHPQSAGVLDHRDSVASSDIPAEQYQAYLLEEQNRRSRMHDRNPSALSYDERHHTSGPYHGDAGGHFSPVHANTSPVAERKLSARPDDPRNSYPFPETAAVGAGAIAGQRAGEDLDRSDPQWSRKSPSRKSTASYGEGVLPGADSAAAAATAVSHHSTSKETQNTAASASPPAPANMSAGTVPQGVVRPGEGKRHISQVGSIHDTTPTQESQAELGGDTPVRESLHGRKESTESVASRHLHMPGEFPTGSHTSID